MPSPFDPPYDHERSFQTNSYACTTCATEWDDEWYCGCDDECPSCGTVMTPFEETIIADNPKAQPEHNAVA